jgi:guanylate kinase
MPKLFVVSAPSGSGKSTLIVRALAAYPSLVFAVSVTTRKPRPGEQEGREYFFRSTEQFREMIAKGELAEYQEIYGNYYGTRKQYLLDIFQSGKNIIKDVDVYGKTNLDKVFPDNVGLFIGVPSLEVLRQRLSLRRTETPEELDKRLHKAQEEITYAKRSGRYEYWLVNDDLERASAEFLRFLGQEMKKG